VLSVLTECVERARRRLCAHMEKAGRNIEEQVDLMEELRMLKDALAAQYRIYNRAVMADTEDRIIGHAHITVG